KITLNGESHVAAVTTAGGGVEGTLDVNADTVVYGDVAATGANNNMKAITVDANLTLQGDAWITGTTIADGRTLTLGNVGGARTFAGTIDASANAGEGTLEIANAVTLTGTIGNTKDLELIDIKTGALTVAGTVVKATKISFGHADAELKNSGNNALVIT